jgi:hypothetical protein
MTGEGLGRWGCPLGAEKNQQVRLRGWAMEGWEVRAAGRGWVEGQGWEPAQVRSQDPGAGLPTAVLGQSSYLPVLCNFIVQHLKTHRRNNNTPGGSRWGC